MMLINVLYEYGHEGEINVNMIYRWRAYVSVWLVLSVITGKLTWECGRVQACSLFPPGLHVQQTAFSKPLRILLYLKYSKLLPFLCSFSHLPLVSIGAPEYQWELLSVTPPPRGSAMNGWLWLPLTAGYTWPMDSLCRPMWISSSSSSVVLR